MFGNFRRYIFEAIIMAVRKLSGETPSCYVTFDIASLLKQSKGRNVDSYPEVRFSVEAVNNNFIVFCLTILVIEQTIYGTYHYTFDSVQMLTCHNLNVNIYSM